MNPVSREPTRITPAPASAPPSPGSAAPGPVQQQESVDVAQLFATLRENWRVVALTAALIFGLVMTHTLLSPLGFRVAGRLYLGDLDLKAKTASQSGDLDITGNAQSDVGSEIEILKSQSLVSRAILDAGLNVSLMPTGWKAPGLWEWLLARRDPALLDLPSKEIVAIDTALANDSLGPQTYTVRFTSATEYELVAERAGPVAKGKLGVRLRVGPLSLFLQRGTVGGPLAGYSYVMVVRPMDTVTESVMTNLLVAATKGTGTESVKVVNLEFADNSPYFAATFLRELMSGYLEERQAWKTEDASAAESFVTDQLSTLRDSLERTERKLADYRSNTRVVVLDNEAKAMIEQVGKYEEQRVSERLQVAALNDIKRALKLPNPPTEAFLLGEAQDTVLENFSKSLSEQRQVLSDLENQFGAGSPQARQAQGQVDVQLNMIRNYVTSRLARAQESTKALNEVIAQFEEKLKTVPGAELGLAQLGRESDVYRRVYSYMLERQQQAAITKASTVSKNRILDYPQIPYHEDSPKIGLRLLSLPLGALLGAVLVLLHRLFSSAFQSESEIRASLGSAAVYASVPRRPQPTGESEPSSVSDLDPFAGGANSPYAEAFRTLRTSLYQWRKSTERGRVALITSPEPGDGKTSTVLSLAASLVADSRAVLVVDADLRKPSHHELAQLPSGPGLRSVLSGQCKWEEALQEVPLRAGSYFSIGAGKRAPAELLSGDRMSRFINEARTHFDFILLDSPSFPLVADALILAQSSDCVLSVLRVGKTPRKTAAEHIQRLSVTAQSYGVVVNNSSVLGSHYPLEKARTPAWLRFLRKQTWITRKRLGWAMTIGALVGAAALATAARRTTNARRLRQHASQHADGVQDEAAGSTARTIPVTASARSRALPQPPAADGSRVEVPSAATTGESPAGLKQPTVPTTKLNDAPASVVPRPAVPRIVEPADVRALRLRTHPGSRSSLHRLPEGDAPTLPVNPY